MANTNASLMTPRRTIPSGAAKWSRRLVALLGLCACDPAAAGMGALGPAGPVVSGAWPAPDGPCVLGPASPTRLLVTTTDFSTGAVTVIDSATLEVTPDVAVGSTDAIPVWDPVGDRVAVVHRFGLDYVDVLGDPGFVHQGQFPIASDRSANPQSIAFVPSGLAWVTTLGTPWLRALDLSQPPAHAEVERVDLSAFADDDGNPDASVIVACGEQLYVGIQRLDASFLRVDVDMLVPLDQASGLPIDIDPSEPGAQGLAIRGAWLRQLRTDPTDTSGQTLLALTSGIERINTATGTVEWAVPESAFAAIGIVEYRQPQAFAVMNDGRSAILAAYVDGYAEVQLFVVGLDDNEPQTPQLFASGLDSVERTLEIVGDRLWYGSTRNDAPGLWAFDLTSSPPTPVAGPLSTGLPPYSMVTLP